MSSSSPSSSQQQQQQQIPAQIRDLRIEPDSREPLCSDDESFRTMEDDVGDEFLRRFLPQHRRNFSAAAGASNNHAVEAPLSNNNNNNNINNPGSVGVAAAMPPTNSFRRTSFIRSSSEPAISGMGNRNSQLQHSARSGNAASLNNHAQSVSSEQMAIRLFAYRKLHESINSRLPAVFLIFIYSLLVR